MEPTTRPAPSEEEEGGEREEEEEVNAVENVSISSRLSSWFLGSNKM